MYMSITYLIIFQLYYQINLALLKIEIKEIVVVKLSNSIKM